MSCPLLRDVLMTEARFSLFTCPLPPDRDCLDMKWILQQSIPQINIANVQARAARTANKLFSEYVWQGELFPIVKAIVSSAYPLLCYR